MKIRSITYFDNPDVTPGSELSQDCGLFVRDAHTAYEAAGYPVQTVRLATAPFSTLLRGFGTSQLVTYAQMLEQQAREMGFEYVSMGPALPDGEPGYAQIADILGATRNVFVSGVMTNTGVVLDAVLACAQVIHRAASLSPDGFANLRFTALANVPAGVPFFPAAYHAGDQVTFSLAIEAADLAVAAFTQASSLEQAQRELIHQVESHASALQDVAEDLCDQFGIHFGGFDFSPAPFPSSELSIGTALERLGLPACGLHGSLAATAFLTSTLDQALFPRAGFNGLMLPVLEDACLAARAAEGHLSIKDLLMYSAVCGTGLDTVPLPGDVSVGQIYAILLDLAALALRLDKPLTARLMPIPGKKAGDLTGFDFEYFANSRVMAVEAESLSGLLAGGGELPIRQRSARSE
jgi:uncharacterized protein (UPF0210 family)